MEHSVDDGKDDDSVEGHVARSLFRTEHSDDSSSSAATDEIEAKVSKTAMQEFDEQEDASVTMRIQIFMHVRLEQNTVGGSIAERLWPAATYLAEFLLKTRSSVCSRGQELNSDGAERRLDPKREGGKHELLSTLQNLLLEPGLPIVELGAGIGLTGLELATQLPCRVLLTDLPIGLTLLRRNIALNRNSFLLEEENAVSVQKLQWGNEFDALEVDRWCQTCSKSSNTDAWLRLCLLGGAPRTIRDNHLFALVTCGAGLTLRASWNETVEAR